jgi:hypothetical protein
VTIFYYAVGIIFGLYVLGLVTMMYEDHNESRRQWRSIQKMREVADQDIELIAAKKRHPAGKRRG